VPNLDQGAVASDWALLPFKVQVTNPGSGNFYLNFPSTIRIYITPSTDLNGENSVTSGETSINSLLDSGSATLYIEGVNTGNAQITLTATGQADPLATLSVTVFAFTGPQNVPNYSIYNYGVTGLNGTPPTTATPWSTGMLKQWSGTDSIKSETVASASVYWGITTTGAAAHVGKLAFTINAYYTWVYFVNVVEIKITSSGSAFAKGTTVTGHFPNGNLFASGGVNGVQGLEFTAWVDMVGPHQNWGVDQVTVGFVQHKDSFSGTARYSGGQQLINSANSDFAENGEEYPAIDTANAGQRPWYSRSETDPPPLLHGESFLITSTDTPYVFVPGYFSQGTQAANPDDSITTVMVSFSFTLDVAAFIQYPAPNNIYTRLATTDWSYVVDGGFTPGTGGQGFKGMNVVNVANPAVWSLLTNGSTENDFMHGALVGRGGLNGPLANSISSTWIVDPG